MVVEGGPGGGEGDADAAEVGGWEGAVEDRGGEGVVVGRFAPDVGGGGRGDCEGFVEIGGDGSGAVGVFVGHRGWRSKLMWV